MTQITGYDVEFVTKVPDDITCVICLFTLKEPVQASPCGHRFCSSCIEDVKKSQNGNLNCPIDRKQIQVFPDIGRKREILNYIVKCTNNEEQCEWTGELRTLQEHVDVCEDELVICTNDGCVNQLKRQNLSFHAQDDCHYRKVKCMYCGRDETFITLKDHNAVCELFPLECENKCGEKDIFRKQMQHHLTNNCSKILHPCSYANVGCTVKAIWIDLQKHIKTNTTEHLGYAVEKIKVHEEKIQEQNEKIKFQKYLNEKQEEHNKKQDETIKVLLRGRKLPPVVTHAPYIWTIQNMADKISNNGKIDFFSNEFTSLLGYRSRLKVIFDHDIINFVLLKGPVDHVLNFPFKGHIDFLMKSSLFKSIYAINATEFSGCFDKPTLENKSCGFMASLIFIADYIINNSLTIKVEVTE